MTSDARPSLLTIPCELRNAIYLYVFTSPSPHDHHHHPLIHLPLSTDPIASILKPQYDHDHTHDPYNPTSSSTSHLSILLTCRQIHEEAHLLAQSLTHFHVVNDASHPSHFRAQIQPLRITKIQSIRNLTLTARISKIRALNEAWAGLPFGHPDLQLDTLTIIPKRPDANYSAYAEIAYHSQAHILAHTFAETFKGLRNVRAVVVRNQGCFGDFFWGLMYKGLVFRMWNWGGHSCGMRFLECANGAAGPGEQWFQAWMREGCGDGFDVGHEMRRFLQGADLPEPSLAGF